MLWIILVDHHAEEGRSNVGRGHSPQIFREALAHAPEERKQAMVTGYAEMLPYEFRLLDDDGNVDYEGACEDLNNFGGDEPFAPLDWAEADTGSTTMEYRVRGQTEWRQL